MDTPPTQPKFEKQLRYLSAYALFAVFVLLGLAITWCMRSDILTLCIALSVPEWITDILNAWGTFAMLIPYVLIVAGLESYMNDAARKRVVRARAQKVLSIEGGLGLLFLALMGILVLLGYPPIL